ncbi:hypothetical protein ORN01_25250 [Bacillus cereus]|uniref:hypothetical protein n=1 Tax=Bacillus cereus group TaxID=86661 RepID=UPI0022E91489|nr:MULTISPECIES: hypothetical protein [Bacillus cereus group]MDA1509617.1 hypothetical protein [Bacillus cereus group sp. TH36-2LC]MDZ4632266.1 hypothetical protein [Bacillus cereus]
MSNTKNKNLTITLNSEEYADLDFLVDYFQEQSISTVTKTDVIKFMLKQMKRTVENDLVKDVNKMIKEAESDTKPTDRVPSKINLDNE